MAKHNPVRPGTTDMPPKTESARTKRTKEKEQRPLAEDVEVVVAALKRLGSKRTRDEMGPRYGIHTDKAFGVPVGKVQQVAKRLGRHHELAAALWDTEWYEARMLAAYVDDPAFVTP
ncbi:MAG: DNA alkylation repair protein, partial [Gemmataceae bacterium]|nr:DNA alkylation repair protein [Gemmataceae bacterium]